MAAEHMNKTSPRKAPMITREKAVLLFETVAIDLVGPFEKSMGGSRYILTYICMASKWPKAIPLKTARAALNGLVEIIFRNVHTYTLLSGQGAKLSKKIMKELCEVLNRENSDNSLQTTEQWGG